MTALMRNEVNNAKMRSPIPFLTSSSKRVVVVKLNDSKDPKKESDGCKDIDIFKGRRKI